MRSIASPDDLLSVIVMLVAAAALAMLVWFILDRRSRR